jgi:hypothetical protein
MTDPIADKLRREADAAKALISAIRADYDDADLVHDATEGETSLMEAIDAALAEIDECEVIVAGCKAQSEVLMGRAHKFSQRKDRVRALIEQAMLIADLPTAKRPTATVTVKRTPPKPIIADESIIPARFFKSPPPVLDKVSINAAVKDGETIPGVTFDNGGVSLQIRRV